MVRVADCCANDLGSIPGQVCKFFDIWLNSSNKTRVMKKLESEVRLCGNIIVPVLSELDKILNGKLPLEFGGDFFFI